MPDVPVRDLLPRVPKKKASKTELQEWIQMVCQVLEVDVEDRVQDACEGMREEELKDLRKMMLKAVEIFKGTESWEGVDVFLKALEDYFPYVHYTDYCKVQFVGLKLTGEAKSWWPDLDGRDTMRYADFVSPFRLRFIHPEQHRIALAKLYEIRCEGTMGEYIRVFRKLLAECPKRSLQDNIHAFTRGLPTKVNDTFWSAEGNFRSLDALFDAVLRYKATHGEEKRGSALAATAKICSHCGRSGHLEEMCWAKYPEQRPLKTKNKRKIASLANEEDDGGEESEDDT
jgi:Retrotransposon gag protein